MDFTCAHLDGDSLEGVLVCGESDHKPCLLEDSRSMLVATLEEYCQYFGKNPRSPTAAIFVDRANKIRGAKDLAEIRAACNKEMPLAPAMPEDGDAGNMAMTQFTYSYEQIILLRADLASYNFLLTTRQAKKVARPRWKI